MVMRIIANRRSATRRFKIVPPRPKALHQLVAERRAGNSIKSRDFLVQWVKWAGTATDSEATPTSNATSQLNPAHGTMKLHMTGPPPGADFTQTTLHEPTPLTARTGSMESSRPLLEGLNRTGDDTQKPPLSSGASIKGKGPSSSDKAPGP